MRTTRKLKIGDWIVTPSLCLVERPGDSRKIHPRDMEVLLYLAEHAERTVSADELIEAVWRDRIVADSSVYECIKKLRKALSDSVSDPRYIATFPRRGYRLTAPVRFLHPGSSILETLLFHGLSSRCSSRTALLLGAPLLTLVLALLVRWIPLNGTAIEDGSDGMTTSPELAEDISSPQYYRLARQHMRVPTGLAREWSMADANQAIGYLRRAIAIDPSFAPAHAALAEALLLRTVIGRGMARSAEMLDSVREEALSSIGNALALDPELPEAHGAHALSLRLLANDPRSAAVAYRKAIALNPGQPELHFQLGRLLVGGALDAATVAELSDDPVAPLRRALEMDPTSVETHLWLVRGLRNLNRYEEALSALARAIELHPTSSLLYVSLGRTLAGLGRHDDAVAANRTALALDPTSEIARSNLARLLTVQGTNPEQATEPRFGDSAAEPTG